MLTGRKRQQTISFHLCWSMCSFPAEQVDARVLDREWRDSPDVKLVGLRRRLVLLGVASNHWVFND
jgi:hypothetical protein